MPSQCRASSASPTHAGGQGSDNVRPFTGYKSGAGDEPATDKQLGLLKRKGVPASQLQGLYKRGASDLIERINNGEPVGAAATGTDRTRQ